MKAMLPDATRTLALFLTLAGTAISATPAHAQNAPLTGDRKAIRDMRQSIARHWLADPEIRKLGSINGTVRFELDWKGRLVGEPQVSVPGGSLSKRPIVARVVTQAIRKAAPFPAVAKSYPLKFLLPFEFHSGPEPAPCEVRSCGSYPPPKAPLKADIRH